MSGYRLRALLEDQEFCNNLANGGNAQLGLLGLGAKEEGVYYFTNMFVT